MWGKWRLVNAVSDYYKLECENKRLKENIKGSDDVIKTISDGYQVQKKEIKQLKETIRVNNASIIIRYSEIKNLKMDVIY